jgi:hypothetical protein
MQCCPCDKINVDDAEGNMWGTSLSRSRRSRHTAPPEELCTAFESAGDMHRAQSNGHRSSRDMRTMEHGWHSPIARAERRVFQADGENVRSEQT